MKLNADYGVSVRQSSFPVSPWWVSFLGELKHIPDRLIFFMRTWLTWHMVFARTQTSHRLEICSRNPHTAVVNLTGGLMRWRSAKTKCPFLLRKENALCLKNIPNGIDRIWTRQKLELMYVEVTNQLLSSVHVYSTIKTLPVHKGTVWVCFDKSPQRSLAPLTLQSNQWASKKDCC